MARHHGVVLGDSTLSSAESSTQSVRIRSIAYIDGFNLFYGLKYASRQADRQIRHHDPRSGDYIGRSLYWLDVQAAVQSQLRRSDVCTAIKYFSAPRRVPKLLDIEDRTPYLEGNERQRIYLEAIATLPLVEVVLGWYSENAPHTCLQCGNQWPHFEEKVTDVNIATHMLSDAYEHRMDRALLMSADADLVPAVEAVRRLGVEVVILLPPGRKRAEHLRRVATSFQRVRIKQLRSCILPESVDRPGFSPVLCPDAWRKSSGWPWGNAEESEFEQEGAESPEPR